MSTLTLTVLRCPEPASTQRRRLQGGSLTLGRHEDSDWQLPDPLRSLSRKHCTVEFYGGDWLVRDLSANGTCINAEAEPIGNGLTRQLRDGDRLRLGDYEIEVRIEAATPTLSSPFDRPDAATSIFGAVSGSVSGSVSSSVPGSIPGGGRSGAAVGGGFGGARLPGLDDPAPYRPFESPAVDPGLQSDHAAASESAYAPPPLDLQSPLSEAPGLIPNNWFELEESQIRIRAPTPRPLTAAGPGPMNFDVPPTSWPTTVPTSIPTSLPTSVPAFVPTPTATPTPTFKPEPAAAPLPPPRQASLAQPQVEATLPSRSLPVAEGGNGGGNGGNGGNGGDAMAAALAAFLQGAQLPADMVVRATADPQQALRNAGALLHATVGGMRSLLMARGTVKREFRIEQTMIRTRENNPLKFSTSDEQAMAALLDPRTAALGAVKESIDDLNGHQVAVMAATQAAARALLKELEPGWLLAEDPGGGFLPGALERRLWEAYKRRHAKLIEQFEDDLKSAFGTAFARAYEDAVGRGKQ